MEEDAIKELMLIKGVGESKARAMYEAGLTSIEELDEATIDELTAIKGITQPMAEKIKTEVSLMLEEVIAEEEEIEDEEVTAEEAEEEIEEEEEPEEVVVVPTAELEMDDESMRLLKARKRQKQKKPHFVQTDQHKKKRLKDTWRRPKGLHNKKRRYILGKGEMARPGYGSPAAVKGLHPSGFQEVLLSRVQELDEVDPSTQAIRIARTVGQRKRIEIVKKAQSMGLKILNMPIDEGAQ